MLSCTLNFPKLFISMGQTWGKQELVVPLLAVGKTAQLLLLLFFLYFFIFSFPPTLVAILRHATLGRASMHNFGLVPPLGIGELGT